MWYDVEETVYLLLIVGYFVRVYLLINTKAINKGLGENLYQSIG